MLRSAIWVLLISALAHAAGSPQFNSKGELLLPDDYREWVYLSSGLGMTYGPNADQTLRNPMFDNVYVHPAAFAEFKKSGKWPEQTIFVLEIRYSTSQGSINKGGFYQTDLAAVEASVKDSSRFDKGWGYFNFGGGMRPQLTSAPALPRTAGCNACHEGAGAVENTFTQFYPIALSVAEAKGTVKPSYQPPPPSPARLFHTIRQANPPFDSLLTGLPEAQLNQMGYNLAGANDRARAIAVLDFAAKANPSSANAQDSLAEILEADGQKARALEATTRALALLDADSSLTPNRRDLLRKALSSRLTRLQ